MKNIHLCTLFEKDYHYGVGALANSLVRCRYRGTLWAGYRGVLPFWASPIETGESLSRFQVSEGFQICFVPVETAYHFGNYKPNFMLNLIEKHCPDAEGLIYFDPDIVIKIQWEFFELWLRQGLAVCEDINSPMPKLHPRRGAWREIMVPLGYQFSNLMENYANSGFVGFPKKAFWLLEMWADIMKKMEKTIGGLDSVQGNQRTGSYFFHTDQDALNVLLMNTDFPISFAGRDGMDFMPGNIMSHAIGPVKPWNAKLIRQALGGCPPSTAEKQFWINANTPIQMYSKYLLERKKWSLAAASMIGRFYRRS